ncbi:unnamed protein product [Lupinus luteus]|uniref:Uncharacterized protein n=1 Tax=Lupinus luteus TaxID=3873 RepID=A0AAV1WTH1_LUPLU
MYTSLYRKAREGEDEAHNGTKEGALIDSGTEDRGYIDGGTKLMREESELESVRKGEESKRGGISKIYIYTIKGTGPLEPFPCGENKAREGILVTCFSSVVYAWGLHLKGPVYISIFKPGSIVIAATLSVIIFLGDALYLGT